jgi:hypothetical protein
MFKLLYRLIKMNLKLIAIAVVAAILILYLKNKAASVTAIPKVTSAQRKKIAAPTPGELVYDCDEDVLYMWNASMGWVLAGSAISFNDFVDATKNTSVYKITQNGLFSATYGGDSIMFYSTDIGQPRTTSQVYAVNTNKGKLTLDNINNTITATYNGVADNFNVVKLAMSY